MSISHTSITRFRHLSIPVDVNQRTTFIDIDDKTLKLMTLCVFRNIISSRSRFGFDTAVVDRGASNDPS